MNQEEPKLKKYGGEETDTKPWYSFLQGFSTEFFGALVPGFVFVFLMMALTCYGFYIVSGRQMPFQGHFAQIMTNRVFWIFIACLSYAVGVVLYRRDPNRPDRVGSYLQWLKTKSELNEKGEEMGARSRLAVQYDKDKYAPPTIWQTLDWIYFKIHIEGWLRRRSKESGDFYDYPYPHMRKYLCFRRMKHIADYIFWCPDKVDGEATHSAMPDTCAKDKDLVNMMKQFIRTNGTMSMKHEAARNEGQIRLLSSIWYAMLYLMRFEVLLTLAVFVLKFRSHNWSMPWFNGFVRRMLAVYGSPAISLTFLGVMSLIIFWTWWMKHSIVKAIHYMRCREVVLIIGSVFINDELQQRQVLPSIKDLLCEDNQKSKFCDGCSRC